KIERVKQPVKSNHVREVVVKICEAHIHTILPQLLSDSDVPAEVLFRFQAEIVSENFVLTARRTEASADAGMQNGIRFIDFVTADKTIGPDATELIKMIKTSASDQDEILDRR